MSIDAEIEKFILTSGVLFEAIRTQIFQAVLSSLNASYEVPSNYKLKDPLFDREDQDINDWKAKNLAVAFSDLGPIHVF